MRNYARSFIIEDPVTKKRIIYCTVDMAASFIGLVQGVVKELKKSYGNLYSEGLLNIKLENLVITAQHTHSGIGGIIIK
jgi:neutral ceramidase